MSRVSVVIPTLFPSPQLKKYATVLTHYSSVSEVIVIVNTNGQDRDENTVHWRFLGKNKGFTGACNAGAKIAKGEFLLFLNDDCEMSEDALQKMVGFLEKNEDVVGTQPIVYKSINNYELPITNYSKEIENIGFWVDTRIGKAMPLTEVLSAKCLVPSKTNTNTNAHEIPSATLKQTQGDNTITPPTQHLAFSIQELIYGLSGTCLLIRKDIFEKVGMWDESFHSYLEDVDLAIRLHKAGYKVAPCLDAEVTHEHMATSSKMGLYKEKQDVKNWWRLVLKHPHVFVRPGTVFPLLLERGRNMSGLIKKFLNRVIQ